MEENKGDALKEFTPEKIRERHEKETLERLIRFITEMNHRERSNLLDFLEGMRPPQKPEPYYIEDENGNKRRVHPIRKIAGIMPDEDAEEMRRAINESRYVNVAK